MMIVMRVAIQLQTEWIEGTVDDVSEEDKREED